MEPAGKKAPCFKIKGGTVMYQTIRYEKNGSIGIATINHLED